MPVLKRSLNLPSFKEAQAWIFLIINFIVLMIYGNEVHAHSDMLEWQGLPAFAGLIIVGVTTTLFTLMFIIPVAIILHKTANDQPDERDKRIKSESGMIAFWGLTLCAVVSLFSYILHKTGDLLFHTLLMSLLVAQLIYALCIAVKYRRVSAPLLTGPED